MAVLKKNQVNQILFTMVDKTDHVTLETSLASNFTIKRVGVNHGSAAANISTLSRAPSKVGSGLYRLSLEANATNYDYVALRIAHASALTQILVYEMRTYDDTDTYSQLSDVGSNVLSYLAGMSNILSAVYVDTADISNVLSNVHADLADLSGIVSDFYSDFQSRVPKELASKSLLSDVNSNLLSYLAGISSLESDLYSLLSDVNSNFGSRIPKEVASKSLLSDVNSNLLSYLGGMSNILSAVYVDTADISNVLSNVHADLADLSGIVSDFYSDFGSRVPKEVVSKSLMSDYHSDLKSAIGNVSVTLGVSDISDIASAVAAGITTLGPSDISDIASAVWAYGTKEVSLGASDLSDIRSVVLSLSGMLSDAHSAAAQANSRALVAQSSISNIYSLMSDFNSNFDSRVPKEVASKSLLSDVNSDLSSQIDGITVTIGASDVSDIVSALLAGGVATQSKLGAVETSLLDTRSKLVVMSGIQSDIYSLLSDINSNFQSRIPKEVASKSLLSDVNSNLLSYLGGISNTLSAVYVDTADISNLVSNIHADLSNLSGIGSNIYSLLSDLNSNLDSRIPKEVATKSLLSDVNSNLLSYLGGMSNTLSGVQASVDIVEDINRNKMEITDANGNLVLYEDDGTTPKYSVNACVTDDATTTIRKRLE